MTEAATLRWQRLPYIVLAAAVVLLSAGPIVVRLAQDEGMPSLVIVAIRYTVAALILTPYALRRKRTELRGVSRRDMALVSVAGMLLVTALTFMFVALEHTTVLIANVVANTSPLWVAFLEVMVLGALLGRRVWMGLVLAMAGTLLFSLAGSGDLSSMGDNPLLGAAAALGSALVSAVYFVVGRAVRSRISTVVFMWIALLAGSGFVALVSLLSGTVLTGYTPGAYALALVVTITGQVLGQSMLAFCLAHLPATLTVVSLQGIGVISAIMAFFVFNERPDPLQIVASGVILAGVVIVVTRR